MKNFKMDKKKKIIALIVVFFIAVVIGLIIAFFAGKGQRLHVVFKGDSSKVNLKQDREDTYSIGVSTSIADNHPYSHDDEAAAVLKKLVYEPLINIDGNYKITYCNAKSITFNKEGREAVVKLNTDKTYSDGEKVKASNVAQSYRWFRSQDNSYKDLLTRISSVKVTDDETLVFTFNTVDSRNITIFNIPIIYQSLKENDYPLGTGKYVIDSVKAYDNITLKPGKNGNCSYKTVTIKTADFSDKTRLIKSQDYDMFLFNKDEHGDAIKKNKAYDIYEYGKETGWFLKLNIKNKDTKNAIGKLVEGEEFFKKTSAEGIYSDGMTNAYVKPNYYSYLDSGNFDETKSLTIGHDYSAIAKNIYKALAKKLKEEGVKTTEKDYGTEEVPKGFNDDITVAYGAYQDMMGGTDAQKFFKENNGMDAEDFYDCFEKFFANENNIVPISKDTVWVAFLAGRDNKEIIE